MGWPKGGLEFLIPPPISTSQVPFFLQIFSHDSRVQSLGCLQVTTHQGASGHLDSVSEASTTNHFSLSSLRAQKRSPEDGSREGGAPYRRPWLKMGENALHLIYKLFPRATRDCTRPHPHF